MIKARKWVAAEFGGSEALRSVEVEVPAARHGQATIAVRAAGMNPADAKHIAPGQDRKLLPLDIGYEVAGVVTEIGDSPQAGDGPQAGGGPEAGGGPQSGPVNVGDEVIAALVTGGYATAMTVPLADLFAKPAPLSFAEAANLMLVGTTAADLLHTCGASAGDTILLHGAAGAVGTSVLQQARVLGVHVIGTASPRNFDLVRQFGGTPVEYGPGLLDRVRAAALAGVVAAVDTVGSEEAGDVSLALVGDRARVVTIAAAARAKSDGFVFVGASNPRSGPFRARARTRIAALAESGDLTVPIAQTFAFDDAPAAFAMLTSPHPAGKLALVNGNDG
jgi:NADPH:quinone reductase